MEDMLKQWIAENGLKPLDAEEEKKLAFSVMTYKRLLKKLEWYNRNPLAVDEAVIAQGKNAMEELVTHMIPLGIKYARKYSARYPESSLTFEDLEQEAFMGIMHAAELYSPDEGTKFSTYAVYWIEQYIRRAIEDKGDLIRKPASAHSRLRMLKNCGAGADDDEISRKTGISKSEVIFLRSLTRMYLISLDNEDTDPDDGKSVRKDIADPKDYRELAEENILREQLQAIIRSIGNEKQRTVMEMHLGMNRNSICFSNRHISSALGMKLSEVTGLISRTVRELVLWDGCAGLPVAM